MCDGDWTEPEAEHASTLSRRDFLRAAGALGAGAALGRMNAWGQAAPGPAAPGAGGVDPESLAISPKPGDADYPVLAAAPDGSAWAVWQTYDHPARADRLFAAHFGDGRWTEAAPVPSVAGDLYKPACAVDKAGRLWVAWSEQRDGDWDLWFTTFDGAAWSAPARVVRAAGVDFAPSMTAAPDGSVVMVWQARREGRFAILMVRSSGQGWGAPEPVSTGAGNDWFPDVAVAPDGTVTVVWDSYRNGNYDVYLRQQTGGKWGGEVLVAGGADFEAYARVAIGPDGAAWIAYEQREANWGKDSGKLARKVAGNTLGGFVRARVRRYAEGKLSEPAQPPEYHVKGSVYGGERNPFVRLGADGRVWLVVRRCEPELQPHPAFRQPLAFPFWKNYAWWLDGDQWRGPVSFNDLRTRADSDVDGIALPGGGLLAVWHSENRVDGMWHRVPRANRIYATALAAPGQSAAAPRLTPVDPPAPAADPAARHEAKAVGRMRSYRVPVDGKECRLFRGDLHRHTDISWDGISDCSITDMFRYAIDAAALDFVAATDHNQWCGIDLDYVWWRSQKITDIFNSPPHFVAFFAYEYGINYPVGHHNVIEPRRGFRALPMVKAGPGVLEHLYTHLHETGGVTIPHTTGTQMGTDWHAHDDEVEPVVEIYQGCRNSYEYEGAPRAEKARTGDVAYKPDGFVWEAWKKGYKIGVIASSDHGSTHVSFANVYASEASRDGLIEAIRRRHTFGSTDNIVLDFRAGEFVQGDAARLDRPPRFTIRVVGTAPIKQLVIFKNYAVAHEARSDTNELKLTWTDSAPSPGENHYYVRALQADGELAWSSPIWLTVG
ncbi:MAG: twin-arginine translocation signal domain-containing protein [bacterium]|nr:twin-arginine translocation signal domain-containing protein [bacterium]